METKNNAVQVPSATLNALKNCLFKDNGVNINPLIDDLEVLGQNRDLVAINVWLTLNRIPIDVDKQPRYKKICGNWERLEFVAASLILNQVKAKDKWQSERQMTIEEWGSLPIEKPDSKQ